MCLRQPRCIYSVCEPLTKNKENRGRSRVIKECIIRYIKNIEHQIWTKLQISEIRMAILVIFVGSIVSLECIRSISNFFDVLCTPWVFTVDVSLMEKPGC